MSNTAQTIEHESCSVVETESLPVETKRTHGLVAHNSAPTTMSFIQSAIERGMGADEIAKFMDLHERNQANEARKQFYSALAAFSESPPVVTKDKKNTQYNSNYASLENTVITLAKHLSLFGLKHHWTINQDNNISVTCVLSHVSGHSESVTMSGPPDESGKKNMLQQIKSTVTYLKLATLESITGTASAEGSTSDDGNGSCQPPETITKEQAAAFKDDIEALGGDIEFFCNWLKVDDLEDIPAKKFNIARNAIIEQKKAAQK